jgi:hypothetical protein
MSKQKVNIDIMVNTADAATNIGQLRKSLKELSFAQEQVDKTSPEFEKLQKAINQTEGRIGDLQDSMKQLVGSGMERLTASTGLLSEGFNNLDLDKVKNAFSGLKSLPKALAGEVNGLAQTLSFANLNFKTLGGGMSQLGKSGVGELTKSFVSLGKSILTNPILLLAGILVGLIAVVIKFHDKIKPIRIVFDAIGEAVGFVIQQLKAFADWLGITDFAGEESANKQLKRYSKLSEATEKRYNHEIALAQAAGKDTYDLEQKKIAAVKASTLKQIEALYQLAKVNGKLNDYQKTQLKELRDKYKELGNEQQVLTVKHTKELSDEQAKRVEDAKKAEEEKAKVAKENGEKRKNAEADILKRIADMKVAMLKDDEAREIAKVNLDFTRAQNEASKSLASNAIKKQLEQQLELEHQAKLDEIKTKYIDIEKAKKAEQAVAKAVKDKEEIDKADAQYALLQEATLSKDELELAQLASSYEEKFALAEGNAELEKALTEKLNADVAVINQRHRDEEIVKEKEKLAIQQELQQKKMRMALSAISILQDATALFTAKNEKDARRQFKINKALSLSSAIVNTALAVTAALTAGGNPVKLATGMQFIEAGMAAASGAVSIAKISGTQFQATGSSDSGRTTPQSANPPIGSQSTNTPTSSFTSAAFYGIGSDMSGLKHQKVYVVESDITKVQNKVNVIESMATQKIM